MNDLRSLPQVDSVQSQSRGNHLSISPGQPAVLARGLYFRKSLAKHLISLLPGTVKQERGSLPSRALSGYTLFEAIISWI